MANAMYQLRGGRYCSAIPQTVSVIEAQSAAPDTSGARCVGSLNVLSTARVLSTVAMLIPVVVCTNADCSRGRTGCRPHVSAFAPISKPLHYEWSECSDSASGCSSGCGLRILARYDGARLDVQFRQHGVRSIGRLVLGHLRVLVRQVAEHDRLRRAGLLAGRLDRRRPAPADPGFSRRS